MIETCDDNKFRSRALSLIQHKLEAQLAKGPKPSFILVLLEKKDETIYFGIKVRADVAYT